TATAADLNRIRVQIVDDDTGAAGPTTVDTIIVNNVDPVTTAIAISPNPVNEGGTVTVTVTFTDPGVQDTFTAPVDWADGSPVFTTALVAGGVSHSFTASHLYVDDNPTSTSQDVTTISVTVKDDDGGSNVNNAKLTINNVAPGITNVGFNSLSINEGGTLS